MSLMHVSFCIFYRSGSISRGFRGEFRQWQIVPGSREGSPVMANQFSVKSSPSSTINLYANLNFGFLTTITKRYLYFVKIMVFYMLPEHTFEILNLVHSVDEHMRMFFSLFLASGFFFIISKTALYRNVNRALLKPKECMHMNLIVF